MKKKEALFPFIKTLIAPYSKKIVIGIASLIMVNILLLSIPFILSKIIDIYQFSIEKPIPNIPYMRILFWASLMLFLNIIIFFLRLAWRRLLIFPSFAIERDLRINLFSHILSIRKKHRNNYETGSQISLISRETGGLSDAISWGTLALIDGLFSIISVSIILLIFYRNISWTSLSLYPLISVGLYIIWQLIGKRYENIQVRIAHITELTRQMFTHIGDIKAHNNENFYIKYFIFEGNKIVKLQMQITILRALLIPFVIFINGLALVLVLYFGIQQIQFGTATLGSIFAVINYLMQIEMPFLGLGFALDIQQKGMSNAHRIKKLLSIKTIPPQSPHTVSKEIKGDLSLKNVYFSYSEKTSKEDASSFALGPINIEIPSGSWVGITGKIGSGKSTLAMLLAGVYNSQKGTILWDKIPITEYDDIHIKQNILLQSQQFTLFSNTIVQNIAFYENSLPQKMYNKALRYGKLSKLNDDIHTLVKKWDTSIGEAGIRLSGGQKQRVALARALFKESPILILDDIFSGLDNKTTSIIMENLKLLRKGQTTFVITHNIPLLSKTDRILILEKGHIIEDGSHKQLLSQKGSHYSSYLYEFLIEQGRYIE